MNVSSKWSRSVRKISDFIGYTCLRKTSLEISNNVHSYLVENHILFNCQVQPKKMCTNVENKSKITIKSLKLI